MAVVVLSKDTSYKDEKDLHVVRWIQRYIKI